MSTPDLHNRFAFHPADTDAKQHAHSFVRQECLTLAAALDQVCPGGRELALAITNLEQTMMWANAAIARDHSPTEAEQAPALPAPAQLYSTGNLPDGNWQEYRKTAITRMIRIDGPFTVATSEGPLHCEDGYLALDARGYPYPIAADEQPLIYEHVDGDGEATEDA